MTRYIAADLGAESGRIIAGSFDGERLDLEELYRFPNLPVRTPDGLHWDMLGIYREILSGLRLAGDRYGRSFAGIGVDSWGVDYGLLDARGRLLGNPYTYRDARTDGLPAEAARRVSAAEQYTRTGIAQMPINTIYQLMAAARSEDRCLDLAQSLLMVPDLLHFWLCEQPACERSNASTSGALGVDGIWARDLLQRLDVPTHMLIDPVAAGTVLGRLRPGPRQDCGLGDIPIIAPATHDTACAVVAVPAEPARDGDGHAYISSGTWSLLGMELAEPNLSEAARQAGFTNEHGAAGTFDFHINIMGLWLVQECRRAWARQGIQGNWSYSELIAQAASIPSPDVMINVDDPAFLHPDDMPAAILASLEPAERARAADPVALVRAILECLALAYRVTVEQVEQLTGTTVRAVHIVGGGARNTLLCQLTADVTGREVLAGPVEATAMGNVLIQAMGSREIGGLVQARAVARASAQVERYEPRLNGAWDERHARLLAMRAKARMAGAGDGEHG
jgi:rhamnulokinase